MPQNYGLIPKKKGSKAANLEANKENLDYNHLQQLKMK